MTNSRAPLAPHVAEPGSFQDFDFHAMAEAARRASAERQAELAARMAAEAVEWERRFRIAVDFLAARVQPMLVDAAGAFRTDGVPVQITNNFEGQATLPALLTFQCCGTPQSGQGAGRVMGGCKILFAHDGEKLRAGIAKSYSNHAEHWRPCEPGEAVAGLIGQALDTYYMAVERRIR